MDWRCGSIDKAPALQAQSPEFKLQSNQKKKKKAIMEPRTLRVFETNDDSLLFSLMVAWNL
jgi:hypothetical protein